MSRPRGWRAALDHQMEEARERAKHRPQPWLIYIRPPTNGVFATERDSLAMVRTLSGMRLPVRPAPTDREGVTYYGLDYRELIVAEESDMPAVMRCVRLTGLHGFYRKAGETKEYIF